MARKGRTKVIYKGTFVSNQSLYAFFSLHPNEKFAEIEIEQDFFLSNIRVFPINDLTICSNLLSGN